MGTLLLKTNLKNIPNLLFFLILLLYPLFSFVLYKGTGMEPNYIFSFICLSFLLWRLYTIYKAGTNLKIPYYLSIFGVFTLYVILSNIFISNEFMDEGTIKYFYSNSLVATFIACLAVENTYFPPRLIRLAIKILTITLILAAIVSMIQILDPLFLTRNDILIQGLSYERMTDYYGNNPEKETGQISRFLDGYRFSIFSYINHISVGVDSIAIFSLLIAFQSKRWITNMVWVIAMALISFLSSSRWIILNFLIVASQSIWIKKNRFLNLLKYVGYGIALLLFLVFTSKLVGFDIQKFTSERLMDKGASTRILAVEVFSKVFLDQPIFGTGGVDTPKVVLLLKGRSSQIHVGYLKLFYYYGLVGGLIYLAFLATLLTRMWKIARRSNYWGGFFAFLAFSIANLTLVELSIFYYGLLLALIFSNHFDHEKSKPLSSYLKKIKLNAI